MKNKYERPKKWAKLPEEFDLRENEYSEVYLLLLYPSELLANRMYAHFNIKC